MFKSEVYIQLKSKSYSVVVLSPYCMYLMLFSVVYNNCLKSLILWFHNFACSHVDFFPDHVDKLRGGEVRLILY